MSLLCTFQDDKKVPVIHIEHVFGDQDFWLQCVGKSKEVFNTDLCLRPMKNPE